MSTNRVSFYLSPFERHVVLCYLSEVLGDIENYKSSEGGIENFEEIIKDEKYKDLNEKGISRVQELLNDANLPLLKFILPEPEEEDKKNKESNESSNEEERYYCKLIPEKLQKIIRHYNVISSFELRFEIINGNKQNEPLLESNNLLNESLFNLQSNLMRYNTLITELLSDVIGTPEMIQFVDLLLSYLVARLIFEELFGKRCEVRLLETTFKETFFDSIEINFFSKFLLNEEVRNKLNEVIGGIPEQEHYQVIRIKTEHFDQPCYFFKQGCLGQLAKKLREEASISRIRISGFGFAEYIKVCKEGNHLYVEEDIRKCEKDGNENLFKYEDVFLIHKKCYNIFKSEEQAGHVLEQYVYLTIREKIARKLLSFIVSRNVQFFILKDKNNEDEGPIEFDIICIPAGDLFKKLLIVECKQTCNNNDVSRFETNVKKVFGKNNAKYIYPAIVFLNSKVENRAQGKSGDVALYSVNEIERLIEDYIKASISTRFLVTLELLKSFLIFLSLLKRILSLHFSN